MQTIIFLLLMCGIANADMYYLVDKDNNVLAKQTAPTSEMQNKVGGFICVKAKEDIDLQVAEYRGGKIITHVATQKELKDAQDIATAKEARKVAKASAQAKLKALGLSDDETSALIGGN